MDTDPFCGWVQTYKLSDSVPDMEPWLVRGHSRKILGWISNDQTIFKQSFGFFAPDTPAFWLKYTRVSSNGSLDTIANWRVQFAHHQIVFTWGVTCLSYS